MHLRRGDLLTRFLLKTALVLQWPNPVAWFLARASREDMEVATDDLVLKQLPGEQQRRAYGNTLLVMARSLSQTRPLLGNHFLGMAEPPPSNLETRIKMIANHEPPKHSKKAIALACTFIASLAVFLGFQPAAAQSGPGEGESPAATKTDDNTRKVRELEQKLKTILLPSIDFSGTKLSEALAAVQRIAKEQDGDGNGVRIFISEKDHAACADVPVTLRLSNVPLAEALRYITSLSQTRYQVTPDGVLVQKFPRRNELFTHLYTVPPTFSSTGQSDPSTDSFAAPGKSDPLAPRMTAKQILEKAGITFGPGASAVYNPSTSQLIVRNRKDQMDLVEAYIESIRTKVEIQIHLQARVFLSKDSQLHLLPRTARELATPPKPAPKKPPLGIVRSFDDSKSMRQFLFGEEIQKQIAAAKNHEKRTAEIGAEKFFLTGILSAAQWQSLRQELSNTPNLTDTLLPGALVRSGQRTVIAGETVAVGVDPVLGVDHFTIDLNLMSRFLGENLPEPGNEASHQATIRDGQSVVLSGKPNRDHHLMLVVTAQIVDPAGLPVQRNEAKGARDSHRNALLNRIAEGWETPQSDWKKQVARADELALEASRLLERGDHGGAEAKYREALKTLPDNPETAERKKAYLEQWFTVLKTLE